MAMHESSPVATAGMAAGELFQIFRDRRGRTKSELAALTGMSRNAVSARVDALIAAGLLTPAGSEASSGGRPPARVAMNPAAGAVLAIDLGATHASVAITDLAATVHEFESRSIVIGDGPEPILDAVFDIGDRLLQRSGRHAQLVGIGIGLPGAVEHATGRPISPPIMPGWDQFDVPEYVHRRFDIPVLVDNDVNILALGEHALTWPDIDDLIFVKVATGLGSGIIAGGGLQRGAQGIAGDIGHVQVPYSHDSPRAPQDERTLGNLASGMAIAQTLNDRGISTADAAAVAELIRAGEPEAIAAARQAGKELGEVLATLVNTLNPAVIVLGGSIALAGEHLLAGVREVVYRRSIPLATRNLAIVQSRGGDRAGVLGAAMLVVQRVLAADGVERVLTSAT